MKCNIWKLRNVFNSLLAQPEESRLRHAIIPVTFGYQRITEWVRLEVTPGGHLVPGLVQTGPRTSSSSGPSSDDFQVSPIVETPVSLENLCQCLVTLIAKKYFLMFRGNVMCFRLCPLSLVLSLKTPEECLLHLLCNLLIEIYKIY